MKPVTAFGLALSVTLIAAVWAPIKNETLESEATSTPKSRNQGLDFKKIGEARGR